MALDGDTNSYPLHKPPLTYLHEVYDGFCKTIDACDADAPIAGLIKWFDKAYRLFPIDEAQIQCRLFCTIRQCQLRIETESFGDSGISDWLSKLFCRVLGLLPSSHLILTLTAGIWSEEDIKHLFSAAEGEETSHNWLAKAARYPFKNPSPSDVQILHEIMEDKQLRNHVYGLMVDMIFLMCTLIKDDKRAAPKLANDASRHNKRSAEQARLLCLTKLMLEVLYEKAPSVLIVEALHNKIDMGIAELQELINPPSYTVQQNQSYDAGSGGNAAVGINAKIIQHEQHALKKVKEALRGVSIDKKKFKHGRPAYYGLETVETIQQKKSAARDDSPQLQKRKVAILHQSNHDTSQIFIYLSLYSPGFYGREDGLAPTEP